jgi:type IV pilus assembly protein PilM
MESQIQLEADQYIPYPLEEVRLDFTVFGPSEQAMGRVDVLLVASRSDNVDVRVAALELGGLVARIVDVEPFAMENAVNFMLENGTVEEAGRTIAVVDIGATVTSLNILKDRRIIYTRDQAFGGKRLTEEIQRCYGLSYAEAGLAKRKGGLPDNYVPEVLEPFKETMAIEVNRALQLFYSSSHMSSVDQILLAGGCVCIAGVPELIEARIGIKTVLVNPFAKIAVSPNIRLEMLGQDAPALMIPFGLALRSFD